MNRVKKGTRLAMVASLLVSVIALMAVMAAPAYAVTKICTQWEWSGACCETALTNEDYEYRVCWYDSDPDSTWVEYRCNFWSLC